MQVQRIQRWFRAAVFKKRLRMFLMKCKELKKRIVLIQRWWREYRRVVLVRRWITGMKTRWLMASAEVQRKKQRINDIKLEILESMDPTWTAVMFRELSRARHACTRWIHEGIEHPNWVAYASKLPQLCHSPIRRSIGLRESHGFVPKNLKRKWLRFPSSKLPSLQ